MTRVGVCGSARELWSIPDQTWLLSSCQGFLSLLYALPQLSRSPSISPLDALCCRTFDSDSNSNAKSQSITRHRTFRKVLSE